VKWDLRRDWRKLFEFEAGKGLEIKAIESSKYRQYLIFP